MAQQLQGVTGYIAEVELGRRNQRVTLEPNGASTIIGSYNLGETTGIVAAPAAGAEIFQFRNSHASNLVVVERLAITITIAAAVTTAQEFGFEVYRATSWSAAGTGGTALDTRGLRRSTMTASSMAAGDIRIATTAALGAGTKTLDSFRIGTGPGPQSNALGSQGLPQVMPDDDYRYSLMVLGNNEGFVVRNLVAFADGSARFHVRILWREDSSY